MKFFRSSALILGLTVLAAGLLPAVAVAQSLMRISIATGGDSHQKTAIDTFAREIEQRTNGRYKILTYYAGALGGEREAIESVQLGTQELTWTSSGPIPIFVPEARIIDIPFLFRDYTHARAVLDGPIGQALLGKFDSKGIKALAWGENGFRHMTNGKHPVNGPEDLNGLKMRTMENPVHIQAYKAFGITPVPMPFGDVYMALQRGAVDGQENPLLVISANRFDRVQKYMTLTGHVYSAGIFLMNKAVFDKLSEADKKIFLEAARVAAKANRDRVDLDEKTAVAELRGKGMKVVDKVDKSKYQAVLAPVFAEFEKQFGKSTLDKIRNYK
jgi:tripartite ATP-independent transporter DctP family solute receptor